MESYRGDTSARVRRRPGWLRDGLARRRSSPKATARRERLVEVLRGEDLPARLDASTRRPRSSAGVVHVTTGCLDAGFTSELLKLAVLTETDLTGSRSTTRDMRRMPSKRRGTIDPLTLKAGDAVVHEQHGVGRYVDLVQRTVAGATREYLVIEYAPSKRGQPGDRLYVPTDSLDQVTKYVGGEAPSLDKMGGGDWAKRKGRARKAVREIAAELIRLYAARMSAPGHAFGPDTPWQHELEDAFAYVETPDQLAAIDEVKADMQAPHPMDRVICGDVGYGKTEIAVRAAFKAVMDGKQAAVLVPTTLLAPAALRHVHASGSRRSRSPSRCCRGSRPTRSATRSSQGLADGTVDVVIGTHRLLQPETRFKDLGLVVVDEEQRFGVEHKEFLKRLRTSVDVLTMSATPIPRTLEMSITGIREMSVIQTPPEERHPVLTFVGAYDERQIAAAIRRELLREGQVFYVHNRVESIDRAARRLRDLVPEARIAGRARPDARAPARAGDARILGARLRRPGLHDDRRERPRHLQRQHPGHRARRPARPLAAASAPWPGRARPRARLRLCPVSAGEAADRGGARPARDDRAARRPRRRHAGRDEGPRDPRRRQPARAASSPATSRPSASTSTCGWSARRSPSSRASGVEELADVRVELPVDAHLPHDYIAGRAAPAGRLPAACVGADRRRRRGGARRAPRPVRRAAADRSRTCWRSRRSAPSCATSGSTEVAVAGQVHPVRAAGAPRVADDAAAAAASRVGRQGCRAASSS